MLGIDGLEVIHIISGHLTTVDDITGNGCRTQRKEFLLELVVRTVVEETQGTSATGRIVDDFCHHRTVFLEEQLVADTNLTGRLHQYVPQTQVGIQLTQQEDLNLGISLLLRTIQTGRKHLRIVEDDDVALVEIVDDAAEFDKLLGVVTFFVFLEHVNGLTLTVNDHHTALVAAIDLFGSAVGILKHLVRRFLRQQFIGQLKSEL